MDITVMWALWKRIFPLFPFPIITKKKRENTDSINIFLLKVSYFPQIFAFLWSCNVKVLKIFLHFYLFWGWENGKIERSKVEYWENIEHVKMCNHHHKTHIIEHFLDRCIVSLLLSRHQCHLCVNKLCNLYAKHRIRKISAHFSVCLFWLLFSILHPIERKREKEF